MTKDSLRILDLSLARDFSKTGVLKDQRHYE